MPTYRVTDPDSGKTLRLTGDSPPTEQELEEIFSSQTAMMEKPQPQESRLRESYREGLGQAAHGVSQIAFGAPELLAQRINPKLRETIFPEPRTPEGKAFRTATDIYSLFGGGAAKLAAKTTTKGLRGGFRELLQKPLLEKAKRSAIGGAVYGGTQLEPESTVGGQALKAGAGAVGGAGLTLAGAGILKTGQAIKKIPKGFQALRNEPEFAKKVREGFQKKRIEAMERFGQDLDELSSKYPTESVNFRNALEEANASFDKEVYSLIKSNPDLKRFADNPELAQNLTAKEAQNILNKINSVRNRQGSKYYEAKDFYYNLREAMLDAFPEGEVGAMRDRYRDIAEPYRLIKSKIKEGSLIKNLADKFGDVELNKRAESLMTKDLKIEVDAYRQTKKLLKGFGILGKTAGTGLAIGAGYKVLNGQ